jgi:hypothetical protein
VHKPTDENISLALLTKSNTNEQPYLKLSRIARIVVPEIASDKLFENSRKVGNRIPAT